MNKIEIIRSAIELKCFVKRTALVSDFQNLIKEDTLITEYGEPKILYIHIDKELTKNITQACKNIKYNKNTRTAGLKTESRIFGYNPRNPIRKNYCSATSLVNQNPIEHSVICDFGSYLSQLYAQYFPDVYKLHSQIVDEKILNEWRIKKTLFTSGIINKNNPLKYHFDGGNIKNALSNMVVLKRKSLGGYLSCPEFNIAFECDNNTAVLFDGQNILHGVTPIKKESLDSYRYSIVYYSLQQIWNCLPINEEIARARQVRIKRETKRAKGEVLESDLERRER